jgi:hypothetical protein
MLNKFFNPYKIRNINFQYVADDNVIKFSFDFEKNDNSITIQTSKERAEELLGFIAEHYNFELRNVAELSMRYGELNYKAKQQDNNCEADFTFTFEKRDKAFKTLEAIIKKYISNNFEYLTKTHSNF